jgi:hypothetical protein
MKIVTDALTAIATNLGVDFFRTANLTELDFNVHNQSSDQDVMVYNGASGITTRFEGAEIIDDIECEIYFLTKGTAKDMTGDQIDTLLQVTKLLANKTYANLNSSYVVDDIPPYELEGVSILTDIYIGHRMTITIPFNNEGC